MKEMISAEMVEGRSDSPLPLGLGVLVCDLQITKVPPYMEEDERPGGAVLLKWDDCLVKQAGVTQWAIDHGMVDGRRTFSIVYDGKEYRVSFGETSEATFTQETEHPDPWQVASQFMIDGRHQERRRGW